MYLFFTVFACVCVGMRAYLFAFLFTFVYACLQLPIGVYGEGVLHSLGSISYTFTSIIEISSFSNSLGIHIFFFTELLPFSYDTSAI